MKKEQFLSERMVFGVLLIGGYYAIGAVGAYFLQDKPNALALTRDVLLTVGPLLGVIVQSIWKADKVDRVNADTASVLAAKQPDLSQVPVPIAVVPAAEPNTQGDNNG